MIRKARKAQKARKESLGHIRRRLKKSRDREVRRAERAEKRGSRDQGKLVIRNLPERWRQAYRALAIMQGQDNAQLLVWLLRTHPDVRAREGKVRGGTVTARAGLAPTAAR